MRHPIEIESAPAQTHCVACSRIHGSVNVEMHCLKKEVRRLKPFEREVVRLKPFEHEVTRFKAHAKEFYAMPASKGGSVEGRAKK